MDNRIVALYKTIVKCGGKQVKELTNLYNKYRVYRVGLIAKVNGLYMYATGWKDQHKTKKLTGRAALRPGLKI